MMAKTENPITPKNNIVDLQIIFRISEKEIKE